ncbi:SdpI family protein [Isoptericola sp. NPDC019693]|uniref:SdpI family protein n=1 Tax=Isoptericola sp. NPDC019693 TaxID=3364009 RepID=UPI0037B3D02B
MVVPVVTAMAVAVMVWLITRAAARGHLTANGAIGIRTPATQRSEEAWVVGHRAALPVVAWGGAVVVVASVVVLVGAFLTAQHTEVAGLVLLVVDIALTVVAGVVAHRAAARVPARHGTD